MTIREKRSVGLYLCHITTVISYFCRDKSFETVREELKSELLAVCVILPLEGLLQPMFLFSLFKFDHL